MRTMGAFHAHQPGLRRRRRAALSGGRVGGWRARTGGAHAAAAMEKRLEATEAQLAEVIGMLEQLSNELARSIALVDKAITQDKQTAWRTKAARGSQGSREMSSGGAVIRPYSGTGFIAPKYW